VVSAPGGGAGQAPGAAPGRAARAPAPACPPPARRPGAPPDPRVPPIAAPSSLYNNIKAPSQLQPSATYYLFKDGIQPKWEDPKNTNGGCWTATLPRAANPGQLLDAWWLHLVRGRARPAAADGRRTAAAAALRLAAAVLALPARLRRSARAARAGWGRPSCRRAPDPCRPRALARPAAPLRRPASQVLGCIGEQFDEGDEVCGVTVNIRNGKNRIELWSKTAANEALQVRDEAGRQGGATRRGAGRRVRGGGGGGGGGRGGGGGGGGGGGAGHSARQRRGAHGWCRPGAPLAAPRRLLRRAHAHAPRPARTPPAAPAAPDC
jgi:hypothetical protein